MQDTDAGRSKNKMQGFHKQSQYPKAIVGQATKRLATQQG